MKPMTLFSAKPARWTVSALCLLTLAGCMVGPDYHQPQLAVPADYKAAPGWVKAAPADGVAKGAWWQAFGDAELDRLEPQVAVNNASLQADYDFMSSRWRLCRRSEAGYSPAWA